MDPFSADGELVNIHNAFLNAQYEQVIDFDTSPLSTDNQLPAQILKYRAQIQLGQADAVISELKSKADSPDLQAVLTFAQWSKDKDSTEAVEQAQELGKSNADNLTVQLLAGSVLAGSGNEQDALALLAKHQGSLDAVALIVQIHLAQNRLDLAQQEVKRARSWADDSDLVNLAESWVGLREGGEKYQAAFYVYEGLATAPSTASPHNTLGQAIAELHLGRLPEAEAAFEQILATNPDDAETVANAVVLNTVLGKAKVAEDLKQRLAKLAPDHPLVADLAKKRELFEAGCAKYTPKLASEVEA